MVCPRLILFLTAPDISPTRYFKNAIALGLDSGRPSSEERKVNSCSGLLMVGARVFGCVVLVGVGGVEEEGEAGKSAQSRFQSTAEAARAAFVVTFSKGGKTVEEFGEHCKRAASGAEAN